MSAPGSERAVGEPAAGDPAAERTAALRAFLDDSRAWVEAGLERALPGAGTPPERLHEALRYAVLGGGKRLRPALVRLVCRELGGTDARALAPALAVELVHGYSLVHDDLPCMDDDDLRRGRPTVHVAYGEALGVLVGDALQTQAFLCLADPAAGEAGLDARAARECALVLARAAGSAGMVGGQVLDLDPPAADADAVRDVHWRKTALLIAASTELGALAAGADAERRAEVARWGGVLGLLFQAVDDLLDVTGDARTLGKTPGKDSALERRTLVAALGLEGARAEAARLAEEARGGARALGGAGGLPEALVDYFLARSS